jgi:DNA helicase IV
VSFEPSSDESPNEWDREQSHLDHLYERVEERRIDLARRLSATLRAETGTAQALVERGAVVSALRRELSALDAAGNGLCFGRLDLVDGGTRRYIGRIGVRGHDPDAEPPLIDWRAPAARAFYTATAAAPQGVRMRRHLHTRGRRLLRLDDEVLDGAGPPPDDVHLSGEAALLATLRASRTGRMRDVVATLQAEQDRIIRSPLPGVLVVQGTPGTGKTVVALHRAAYLLYSHPRLQDRGVLVVAPNPVFLRYISQVLPGLGETSVLLSAVSGLFPGVDACREEADDIASLKGRPVMAEVVARAVRDRQGAVRAPVDVLVDGERVRLEPQVIAAAADRARATGRPHNLARAGFHRRVIVELARRLARVSADLEAQLERDLAGQVDAEALDRAVACDLADVFGDQPATPDRDEAARAEIAEREEHWAHALPQEAAVRRLLDELWPRLTPQQLLEDLFADEGRLSRAAASLSPAERRLLHRDPGGGWTPGDVPLLDEAAELLGVDTTARDARLAAERALDLEYARGVLQIAHGSRAGEDENAESAQRLSAADLLNAGGLADRHSEDDHRTVAERAAADRDWVFGHVVVDEAQELSPMVWRLLVRRCPTRSFTVVGDIAQTGTAGGSTTWDQALHPFFGRRWRLEQLTVNYRTPAEIMAASDRLLSAIAPELHPARPVRRGGRPPVREQVPRHELARRAAHLAQQAEGSVAIVVPRPDGAQLARAVTTHLPDARWGADPDLERPVVVLTVPQVKGLEFDTVIVVDPQALLDGSAHGRNDLYVALTRPAHRLVVLHPGPVPPVLAHLPNGADTQSAT